MLTKSFGSQIRGGESSCRLRISTHDVFNPGGTLDVAVALNWEDFLKFGAELPVGGHTVVIYDSKTGVAPDRIPLTGVTPRGGAGRTDQRPRQADRRHGQGEEHRRARSARRLVRHRARRHPRRHAQEVRQEEPRSARRQRARLCRRHRLRGGAPAAQRVGDDAAGSRKRRAVADRRQRDLRRSGDLRRLRVLRRLSDHAIHRDHAVPQPRAVEVWRHGAASRGRDRRRRRRRRRVVRRQEGDDRDLRTGDVAEDRNARPGEHRRAAARVRQRPARRARRPVCPPRASSPISSRPSSPRMATPCGPVLAPIERRRHVPRHRRGLQHRRGVSDTGDRALGSGDRAAQGDGAVDRHPCDHGGRSPPADTDRAGALRALPHHRVGHQPDQPAGHGGRQLPGVGHRAQRARRTHRQRRGACAHEREAPAQAEPAEAASRSVPRSRATPTHRSA